MIQKSTFIDDENWVLKMSKNDAKMTSYKLIKNRPKSAQNLICRGGGQNRQKSTSGTPDPQNGIF
jgi:hypothetical protein